MERTKTSQNGHYSNGKSNGHSASLRNGHSKTAAANKDASEDNKVSYTQGASIVPPLLVFLCPAFAMIFSYMIVELNGSPSVLFALVRSEGFLSLLQKAWLPYIFGSPTAWKYILPYAVFQLLLMRVLPGKETKGPVTPAGNVPVYKANGLLSYAVTLAAFFGCAYGLRLFDPADIYDHYLEIIGALNVVSLVFCGLLVAKGRVFPSSSDNGSSGNFLFDYYWGTELYPRVLGWDVKMFTNCRFGMMGWPLLIICYAAKQHQLYGLSDSMLVCVGLQLMYVTKFFHWEMGYMKTLDIMHDRAGFYLCWGCLVWVPSVYTSHTLYLTNHPNNLGLPLAVAIFTIGIISVIINYDADRQKEMVRNTNANCTIWGRKPTTILATYKTTTGVEKKSLLLVSGWWGVSRHFHYIPELMAAFAWTVPALFESPVPYFYFVFLVILLFHRAVRDDVRCKEKYGGYWDKYCKKVPSKIIPFLF